MSDDKEDGIVNRVANSGIIQLELDRFYQTGDRVQIDLAELLERGFLLREKTIRDFIDSTDWSIYAGKFVAVHCSADAVIPSWAYMLIGSVLAPYARVVVHGNLLRLEEQLFSMAMDKEDWSVYTEARVMVKGCGRVEVPEGAFMEATRRLRPFARSIMFGEACSSVPVYKKK